MISSSTKLTMEWTRFQSNQTDGFNDKIIFPLLWLGWTDTCRMRQVSGGRFSCAVRTVNRSAVFCLPWFHCIWWEANGTWQIAVNLREMKCISVPECISLISMWRQTGVSGRVGCGGFYWLKGTELERVAVGFQRRLCWIMSPNMQWQIDRGQGANTSKSNELWIAVAWTYSFGAPRTRKS